MPSGIINTNENTYLTSDVAFSSQQGNIILDEEYFLRGVSPALSSQRGRILSSENDYLSSELAYRVTLGILPTTMTRNIKTIQKIQQWFD